MNKNIDQNDDKRRKKRRVEDKWDRKNESRKKSKKSVPVIDHDNDHGEVEFWVEKNIDICGEKVLEIDIPSEEGLKVTSNAVNNTGTKMVQSSIPIKRDEWMLAPDEFEDADFFSTLGFEPNKCRRQSGAGGGVSLSGSQSFRRPGDSLGPGAQIPDGGLLKRREQSEGKSGDTVSVLSQCHTSIPSVMAPAEIHSHPSRPSLNKLQAQYLRENLFRGLDAKHPNAESEGTSMQVTGNPDRRKGVSSKTELLPTLDGFGRMYDVGHGKDVNEAVLPRNCVKRKSETRNLKTGDVLHCNADDDSSLTEMLKEELFNAGRADQKNPDAQLALAIMKDGKFENDLEYMDDQAENLGRRKMRSDAMKRQFAIHDYRRTQRVLATCNFCFGDDDSPPKVPVVAMGTRVYLSCTRTEELVEGHCLIVPIQHHLCMLEGDDDVWDEVRNFMKCLTRMFAVEDKGVIFYETVITFKWQKHTVIECVPLPWRDYDVIPGYFKESILASEMEWSQHKKLINFSERPGGFRRCMVPNLPYFMIQFDHKGERGFGHIIEGHDYEGDLESMDMGEKGADFSSYFAAEIIGNVLEIEPRRWRRPKRLDFRYNKERIACFRKKYEKFDWTVMIER